MDCPIKSGRTHILFAADGPGEHEIVVEVVGGSAVELIYVTHRTGSPETHKRVQKRGAPAFVESLAWLEARASQGDVTLKFTEPSLAMGTPAFEFSFVAVRNQTNVIWDGNGWVAAITLKKKYVGEDAIVLFRGPDDTANRSVVLDDQGQQDLVVVSQWLAIKNRSPGDNQAAVDITLRPLMHEKPEVVPYSGVTGIRELGRAENSSFAAIVHYKADAATPGSGFTTVFRYDKNLPLGDRAEFERALHVEWAGAASPRPAGSTHDFFAFRGHRLVVSGDGRPFEVTYFGKH